MSSLPEVAMWLFWAMSLKMRGESISLTMQFDIALIPLLETV